MPRFEPDWDVFWCPLALVLRLEARELKSLAGEAQALASRTSSTGSSQGGSGKGSGAGGGSGSLGTGAAETLGWRCKYGGECWDGGLCMAGRSSDILCRCSECRLEEDEEEGCRGRGHVF